MYGAKGCSEGSAACAARVRYGDSRVPDRGLAGTVGLRTRRKETGPPSLWDALAAHAIATGDLTRLGGSARQHGLKRHAAALWTKAAVAGDIHAALGLLSCLGQPGQADFRRAARWAAVTSALDDSRGVADLLHQLVESGANDAVATLLARDPVAGVGMDDPEGISYLIAALQTAGAQGFAKVVGSV